MNSGPKLVPFRSASGWARRLSIMSIHSYLIAYLAPGFLMSIGLTSQWGRGPICPPEKYSTLDAAVSVDMNGPILYRIIYTLMPMSQLFCEEVAL
jgi:hypothetical protein